MTNDTTRTAWIALSLIPNLGGRTLRRLLDQFESPPAVLEAGDAALRAVHGVGPKLSTAIRAIDLDAVQAAITAWQADGITISLVGDPAYPAPLAALDDAPPTLFLRGALAADASSIWDKSIAIIGTRRPRPESAEIARALAAAFAAQGWLVVSGLAAGIDAAAHAGACAAGRTAAVLGCGVRAIYPTENHDLAARILAQGVLLSETHPDAPPSSPALVARNRLISGLSRAVIVIETGLTGGSLHTVRFARVQRRPVYAIADDAPGNQQLIAEGAIPLAPTPADWKRLQKLLEG